MNHEYMDGLCELGKELDYLIKLQMKVNTLESLSGFSIDEIIESFKTGFKLSYNSNDKDRCKYFNG